MSGLLFTGLVTSICNSSGYDCIYNIEFYYTSGIYYLVIDLFLSIVLFWFLFHLIKFVFKFLTK